MPQPSDPLHMAPMRCPPSSAFLFGSLCAHNFVLYFFSLHLACTLVPTQISNSSSFEPYIFDVFHDQIQPQLYGTKILQSWVPYILTLTVYSMLISNLPLSHNASFHGNSTLPTLWKAIKLFIQEFLGTIVLIQA